MNEKNTGRDCGCNADIPAEDTAEMKKAPDSKPEEKKSEPAASPNPEWQAQPA